MNIVHSFILWSEWKCFWASYIKAANMTQQWFYVCTKYAHSVLMKFCERLLNGMQQKVCIWYTAWFGWTGNVQVTLVCVSFKFEMVQLMLMCLFEHQLQRLNSGFIHINFMFVLAADVICNRNILQIWCCSHWPFVYLTCDKSCTVLNEPTAHTTLRSSWVWFSNIKKDYMLWCLRMLNVKVATG